MSVAVRSLPAVGRTPPHNLDAEKSVLGAVFIKPAAFDELASNLAVDDFFLPAHREIYEAMLAIDKRRQPIDVLAVGDELKTAGLLSRLEGGSAYLNDLANAVPTAENVAHYARIVKEKATLRRLIAACAEIQSTAYGDFGELGTFFDEAEAKIVRARGGATTAPRPEALVDRLVDVGEPLATGQRTLDENCRGGFRCGRRVIVGGAPSAGKTTLVLGWAIDWARGGAPVAVLAADESAADLLVRVGQMLGLDREALEAGEGETLDRLRAELRAMPTLAILDGDDGATIETAVATVRQTAGAGPAAIVVDGIQTARAAGTDDAEGPRARVDAVLRAIRRASRDGMIVVATSELARGAYRSHDARERIDDLAAGKESGGIEYAAQTLLVLRPVAEREGEVDVAVAKNRGGKKAPFRLVLDFTRARVHETARPAGPDADPGAELAADMEQARKVLREFPGIAGADALLARLGRSKARGRAAIRTLQARGEIKTERGQGTARRLFLIEKSPESPQLAFNSPGASITTQSPNSPEPAPQSPGEWYPPNSPNSPAPLRGGESGASRRVVIADGADSPRERDEGEDA